MLPTLKIGNDEILSPIPKSLRLDLFDKFNHITINYRENRWEPSELNGGKFCEIVYTIIKGYIDGIYPTTASKPPDFLQSCRSLELLPSSYSRSIRIQIPRMLIALYEIRNNRGVGHAGGDLNPNKMDATCIMYMSKWILAELIRIFHNVDTETAESSINILMDRTLPVVWQIDSKIRVLNPSTTMKEKTLLILYQSPNNVKEQDIVNWVEHSNSSIYRRDILRPLHKEKLIEYDENIRQITISPRGIAYVELKILPKLDNTSFLKGK